MGRFVADEIADRVVDGRALVLGVTFKENVPDLRNSQVVDVVQGLKAHGLEVDVHDPLADAEEAASVHGMRPIGALDDATGYDVVVGAVAHDAFRGFTTETFARIAAPDALIADVKGMWRDTALPAGMRRWEL